jgi:hypothetical protein
MMTVIVYKNDLCFSYYHMSYSCDIVEYAYYLFMYYLFMKIRTSVNKLKIENNIYVIKNRKKKWEDIELKE